MKINFHQNKNKIIIISVLATLFLFFFFSDYGFMKRIELEMETTELDKEIILRKQTTDSILNHINKLKYDTLEIERIAREKHGMVKPDEEVYYIKK